jgi:hypothetical protein
MEFDSGQVYNHATEIANMLRQQQAEIEALKAELRLIDELVAGKDESFDRTASHMAGEYVSYPAKILTNEEIEILASKHLCYQIEGSEISGVFNFARAILRKAQE